MIAPRFVPPASESFTIDSIVGGLPQITRCWDTRRTGSVAVVNVTQSMLWARSGRKDCIGGA